MNISVLRIAPNVANNEIGKKIEDLLESAGFKKNQRLAPYRTYIVSLEEDEQEIYARFNKDRRRIIRKAGNARIEVREGTDMESFRILENLYAEAKDRKGFKGLDSAEFAQTQQLLAQSEKAIILIAYCDGQPVTAHATTHFGVTAVPILSASTKMGLECGTPSLLFWKAYVIAKNLGMQYYDLGGIDPDENPKGYLFKKDMGGEESLHIGTFEAYTNPLMLRTFHMAEKCYRIIKKRA
jgi:lipid II:glycine glycyltransferase (peptidoglycan interpeptide bridge formation enzyme)